MVNTLDDSGRSLPELIRSTRIILDTITYVESEFILHKDAADLSSLFSELLNAALSATHSEKGFLIQLEKENGALAAAPLEWRKTLFLFLKGEKSDDPLFKDLTLTIKKKKPLLTSHSPYSITLPLINKDNVVGLLFLSRSEKPYSDEAIHLLLPILQVAIIIMEGSDIEQRRKEAEEKALAANRAKSTFLANMSHEVKTPLNGIVGMTDLLLRTELTAKQTHFLEKLRHSTDHLLSLMNNLLDLSTFESGIIKINKAPLSLKAVTEELFDMLHPLAEAKKLKLNLSLDSQLKESLFGDALHIKQILANLLSNAIKFTEEGSVTLTIKKNGEKVLFSVSDTGIGIPENLHKAIFEPFVQGDSSLTRKYGGAGLGLSIASYLVKSMGGEIHLSSSIGKGSSFSFELEL